VTLENKQPRRKEIPQGINLSIAFGLLVLIPASLWQLTNAESIGEKIIWIACFVLLGHLNFSLLHEAEHDKLHANRVINQFVGTLLSALFPSSYSILRSSHLRHHARNRSDAELIDYYYPDESRAMKTLKYYVMLGGVTWLGLVVFSFAMVFLPNRMFRLTEKATLDTRFSVYVSFLADVNLTLVRIEVLILSMVWALLWILLNLDLWAVVAFISFGIIWSSQQFIYHVRTPRHLVEGSANVSLMWPFNWFLLHGNYHLTHHRYPREPWIKLPDLSTKKPAHSYLAVWLDSLRPPLPIDQAWPKTFVKSGELPEALPAGKD
jgi:fatty acid desaturase